MKGLEGEGIEMIAVMLMCENVNKTPVGSVLFEGGM